MKVNVVIFYYKKPILKIMYNEFNNREITIKEEGMFDSQFSINVNSFNEIISMLIDYKEDIEIDLHIINEYEITLFIKQKQDYFDLGNQVE